MSSTTTVTEAVPCPTPAVKVIKNGFGAEITGLDFTDGVTDEAFRFIEAAVKKVRHIQRVQPTKDLGTEITHSMALPLSVRQTWLTRPTSSLLESLENLTM